MWKNTNFEVSNIEYGHGWIGLYGKHVHSDFHCFVIGIYAPCNYQDRQQLWDDLILLKHAFEVPWIIAGDFNETLSQKDRNSGICHPAGSNSFSRFLQTCELTEYPLAEGYFTWFRGRSKSKLDRMFANSSYHLHFPSLSLRRLPREFSDHCPLILSSFLQDHGWRPFRFLDCWTQYPNFKHIIENFWNDACSLHPGRFKFLKKLNHIAVRLRQWNKIEFGNQEAALQRTLSAINMLERKCEEEGITDQEQEHLDFLLKDRWVRNNHMESIWRQKSRQMWCELGEKNNKFFHLIANFRKAKSSIFKIHQNGNTFDSQQGIKQAAVDYFSELYDSPTGKKPQLNPLGFKCLSKESSEWLEQEITMEEVKRSVWGCDGSKCPGPDGFNFKFYRLAWDFIAQDILDIVLSFFRTGRLPKGINTTYVTLLSKTVEPKEFKDFRPISMIHGIYKIIVKILASRLKIVMQDIISINQSAFIADRNIIDDFMIANELVSDLKKRKAAGLIFKIDFHKAFDSISWIT